MEKMCSNGNADGNGNFYMGMGIKAIPTHL